MDTIIRRVDNQNIDHNIIEEAAGILKKGGLVAFPTETVYGIGAHALDLQAVLNIYKAKGRPSDNPLIVHVAHMEDVNKYARYISDKARKLMEHFWPGPLTLIFPKKDLVPNRLTGGLGTVAIRVPSHPIARSIIEAADLPVAAPSANVSGRPSPTTGQHVINDLQGRVDMIIDGGSSQIGLESTVLDVSEDVPVILRPGGITHEMLVEVIGEVVMDPALTSVDKNVVPKAPGMKYRHYAPEAELIVFEGKEDLVIGHINKLLREANEDTSIGIIATKQTMNSYKGGQVLVIGDRKQPQEIASNLFKVLREFDRRGVDRIYSEAFSSTDIGCATMNRLLKAAGNTVIHL